MLQYVISLPGLISDRLRRDDRGATAVEYGLIVVLIAIAIIVAVTAVGTSLTNVFTSIANAL